MPKEIWVIESGSYSNYSVVGVFSSEENAKLARKKLGLSGSSIDKWVLDPGIDEIRKGQENYVVHMLLDGEVQHVSKATYPQLESDLWLSTREKKVPTTDKLTGKPKIRVLNVRDKIIGTVWARNKTHAVKIVNEIRAQKIASGEWSNETE